jgi:diguanylate cyclase (GGDEF)-like protein/PAS domain S-box-containing protein
MKKIIKKRVSNNKAKIKTAEGETPELNQMLDIYRNMVEATSDSMYMVDSKCRYIYANPRYCSRLCLPLKDIIDKKYADFHSSEETQAFAADVAEVFQKGLSFQREYKSKRDGNEFLRTTYPIRQPADTGEITAVSVIAKDISQLRHVEHLYSTLAKKSPISVFIVQDGNIQWSNKKLQESTGYKSDELINMPYSSLVYPDDRELLKNNSIAMLRGEISLPFEYRLVTKAGDILWHVGTVTSITHNGKRAILGSQINITQQKKAETDLRQSEERYRTIIDTITDAYYEVDLAGNNTVFNDAYLKLYEYSAQEMQGKNYRTYADKENAEIAYWVFHQVFKTGKPTKKMEWEIITKNGKKKQVELSVNLIHAADGKPIGFRGIISDITDRRKAEETIRHQAFHDSLTGLANRTLFYDRIHMAFNSAKRNKQMVAVILLDLDNFKGINDNKGHRVGDEILKSISDRLSKMVRASDTVARYGGDEFTLIIPSLSSEENALIVAQKIVKAFNEPFHLDDGDVVVTASLGVAMYSLHGQDIDTLMSKADAAMYRAKTMGRNKYCWYGNAEVNPES